MSRMHYVRVRSLVLLFFFSAERDSDSARSPRFYCRLNRRRRRRRWQRRYVYTRRFDYLHLRLSTGLVAVLVQRPRAPSAERRRHFSGTPTERIYLLLCVSCALSGSPIDRIDRFGGRSRERESIDLSCMYEARYLRKTPGTCACERARARN